MSTTYDDLILNKIKKTSDYGFECDEIFSPFTGIGSEGFCSVKQGRRFVGSELKESYFKQAVQNITKAKAESETLFDLK